MKSETTKSEASIERATVLAKFETFTEFQLYPVGTKINPTAWLSNFSDEEQKYALHLLRNFLFISKGSVDELFKASFQKLCKSIVKPEHSLKSSRIEWNSFFDQILITRVTGETPNDTDSGYMFARLCRQVVGLRETQIVSPEVALQRLHREGPQRVVFVDDFIGSGNQMKETWKRPYIINGLRLSFEQQAKNNKHRFYYCAAIGTSYGLKNLSKCCRSLKVFVANELSPIYGAQHKKTLLWPSEMRKSAKAFLEKSSKRAGIPKDEVYGFHSLGLALAFEHCVPDATLPLFFWNKNGWKPLIERT